MECIKTYDDLTRQTLWNRKQFWYYVILVNPMDYSKAGKTLMENLDYFNVDSGKDVIYFIPGFLNTDRGILKGVFRFFRDERTTVIPIQGFGEVEFYLYDFIDFIHQLEARSSKGWRYSGECELLLFNIDDDGEILMNEFASYNLDDILRNGRNLSSFIRKTINIGMDAQSAREAKRQLDEVYANLILPDDFQSGNRFVGLWDTLMKSQFKKEGYYFISYSSNDYHKVSVIRDKIEAAGIQCWMAPRDIKYGTNYAYVIEMAIRHAQKFILILSQSSVWSVWVEKELQRAIHHFQHESSDRIIPVWLSKPFNLEDTPMAYSLEGVQILGSLGSESGYRLLLPEEVQENMRVHDALQKVLDAYCQSGVSILKIKEELSRQLSIAYTVNRHINEENIRNTEIEKKVDFLRTQCSTMQEYIRKIERMNIREDDFYEQLRNTMILSDEIRISIKSIMRMYRQESEGNHFPRKG